MGLKDNEFIYDIKKFSNQELTYFPLHGCIYLKQKCFGVIEVSYIAQSMSDYAQSNRGGNPNRYTLFTPIISGYNKLEHINGQPFNFGHHVFAADCFDSKLIVTFGFSFSDPHINSILSTFGKCPIKCVTLNTQPNGIPPEMQESRDINYFTGGVESYLNSFMRDEQV